MKIGKDKIQHMAVCAQIAAASAYTVKTVGAPSIPACVAGFISGMSAGVGKEYGDKKAPGNKWDWLDIAADALGSLIGSIAGFIPRFI